MPKTGFKTIDEYIGTFPEEVQEKLEEIRQTITKAAPEAEETISYQMPTFRFYGNLVYFAAYENHIGFYPTPSAIKAFQEELGSYEWAKGSVRFPLERPIPYDLITRIVKFRIQENHEKKK